MPHLLHSRDALIEAPEERGLRYVHPWPRPDGPQVPLRVTEVKDAGLDQILTYERKNLGSKELTTSDMIWHQESNAVVIVVGRIANNMVRVRGVVWPDTQEEIDGLEISGGLGTWVPVWQGWLTEWELPSELVNLTEMVDLTNIGNQHLDFMPETRKHNREPWGPTGKLPQTYSPMTSAFLKKQRQMMHALAAAGEVEDEEETGFPDAEQVKAEGMVDTVIPPKCPRFRVV